MEFLGIWIREVLFAAMMVGSLVIAFYVVTQRWSALAAVYQAPDAAPVAALQHSRAHTLILRDSSRMKPLYMPALLSMTPAGLHVQARSVMGWFLPPMVLPFGEVQLLPTYWPADPDAWKVVMARRLDLEIILTGDEGRRLHGELSARRLRS